MTTSCCDNQPGSGDSHETWLGFITAHNLVGRAWLAYRRRRPSVHDAREIARCWNLRDHEWPFPWRVEVLAGGKRGTARVDRASRLWSRGLFDLVATARANGSRPQGCVPSAASIVKLATNQLRHPHRAAVAVGHECLC